jgi:hypothetical protein
MNHYSELCVNLEQALQLEKLGFIAVTPSIYHRTYHSTNLVLYHSITFKGDGVRTPTYEQAFDWIEMRYKIFATIRLLESSSLKNPIGKPQILFTYDIVNLNDELPFYGTTKRKKESYTDKNECKSDCLSQILDFISEK